MTLLAIDPGRSVKPSIGWAVFDGQTGEEQERGELNWDGLWQSLRGGWMSGALVFSQLGPLRTYTIFEVVIENFINNPKSRGGQTNGTSETIGAVEILATQAGIPFTRQPSSILGAAKLLADYQGTLQHLPHQDSAYLHGYYYLVGKGVLQSKGLESTL